MVIELIAIKIFEIAESGNTGCVYEKAAVEKPDAANLSDPCSGDHKWNTSKISPPIFSVQLAAL